MARLTKTQEIEEIHNAEIKRLTKALEKIANTEITKPGFYELRQKFYGCLIIAKDALEGK